MMKRVLILGSPGAGKSTFARKLQSKTKLPLVYMDQLFFGMQIKLRSPSMN